MVDKSEAIRLAEWAEWFLRNVNDPEDFRWKHMAESATELRRLYALNQELLNALIEAEKALDILWLSHHANRTDATLELVRKVISKVTGKE